MGLVEEAQRLTPEIEAAAEEGERLRRLPDTTWKGMHDAGLFRALQPARWGGREVQLREFVDAVIQVGRASGSASWVLGVIGVHPWQLALFSDEAQHDVWGTDNARMHYHRTYRPARPRRSLVAFASAAAGRSRRALTSAPP